MSRRRKNPPRQASPKKIAIASAIGATIEWYDFFIYSTGAALVFDRLFFNALSGTAAMLASFGSFAVGFMARPLGGWLFGHLGDRLGRKRMLIWTLVIMGIATTGVGLLPTYDQIGVAAPLLLVLLRIAQGIGVGGEYGGAVLLAVEFAPAGRRGFFGSMAHMGGPCGLALASGAFVLVSQLPPSEFLSWGWRICFLASIPLLAVGVWIRLRIIETPVFQQVQAKRQICANPTAELLRQQPRTLLLCMGTRYVEGVTFNLYSVFLLSYAVRTVGTNQLTSLFAVAIGAAVGSVLVLVSGNLSDRFGRKPVYVAGVVFALIFAFPATGLVASGTTFGTVATMIGGLGVATGIYYGPLAAFWSELFDARYRYSALSTLYQVSGIVASGLTPIIAAWLVVLADGALWPVACYAVVVAVISLWCVSKLPETRWTTPPGDDAGDRTDGMLDRMR